MPAWYIMRCRECGASARRYRNVKKCFKCGGRELERMEGTAKDEAERLRHTARVAMYAVQFVWWRTGARSGAYKRLVKAVADMPDSLREAFLEVAQAEQEEAKA